MSELILPTERHKIKEQNPRILIVFGRPKSGKTTLLSMLDNNLIIDLEHGTDQIESMSIEANNLNDLRNIRQAVINAGKPYRYITIDNITKLEDLAVNLALINYRKTPMGVNFGLNPQTGVYDNVDIRTLPNGAAYLYIRLAFDAILSSFEGLSKYLILIAHTKDKTINRNGKDLSENSIDLSGKLERITAANADAIGYLYREGNQNYLNFNGGGDFIVEARAKHLRGQNILLAESDDNGDITAYWDKIYKNYDND